MTARWLQLSACSTPLISTHPLSRPLQVLAENKTIASITYQSLFKMYDKLSGMSGTAQTEEEELFHTYGLSVVPVPTNKPVLREDRLTRSELH